MRGPDDLIVGRYRLVRSLATGGMGTVWEGWDERLHRPVAIKQLHALQGLSEQDAEAAKNRAMREARITARLHHPHAVPVYDVVDHDGRPVLIMQYLPSMSLAQLVSDKGVLTIAECARVGKEIASALAAAHGAGIVHRDVKPGNVLIAEDGTAKITDFGISHALDDVTVTSTGMVSGTPAYLAPEVARGADSGFASDVFSLGSTLYFALEGTPPFGTGANPMATLHRVASGLPNPPAHSGPMTPVLEAMLAPDPVDRPPMLEVVRRLAAIADAVSATADETVVFPVADSPDTDASSGESSTTGAPTTALPASPVTSLAKARLQALPPMPSAPRPSAPRPSEPRPSEPRRSDPPQRGQRRGPLIPVLAALVVIGLGLVLAVVLLGQSGGNGTPTAGGTRPASTAASASSSPASSSRSSSPQTQGKPTATQLAQAITAYYRLLPGNLDQGWQRLTGQYQRSHAQGRTSYNSFWGSIARVAVTSSRGSPPGTVTATIRYFYKSGRVVDERTIFGMVRDGAVLKIATSSVQSSVTR